MNISKRKFEKLSREERISLMFDLINSFRVVKKPYETALFLQDLLTANEIRNLSIRLRIAKLLLAGNKHRDIQNKLHTSPVTIAKVRAWLDDGGDGFKKVIKELPLKWDIPKNLPRGPIEFHLPQTLLALGQIGISTSQDKRVEKFIDQVNRKKASDRLTRKITDEHFKEKAVREKSAKTRISFKRKIEKAPTEE